MINNIFLPYSGNYNEIQALQFASILSGKLKANIDVGFVSSVLQIATSEENIKAGQIYESKGYYASQDFLEGIYKEHLKKNAVCAKDLFELFIKDNSNKSRFAWAGEIDVFYDPNQGFESCAYLHDLTLASFNISPSVYDELLDRVLFATGRSILFVGDTKPVRDDLIVVIAWKPSSQSIHAISTALPILQAASKCYLVAVEESEEDRIIPSANDFAKYLAAKNVNVEAHICPTSDIEPYILLSDYYKKVGADLMVLGAYSHSRIKELVLGGCTQYFLNNKEYNLFMAH